MHKKIFTSAEVWAVIKARHPELKVFSSYSAPDGVDGGTHCEMFTEYGFADGDFPVIGARTTWEKHWTTSSERVNKETKYWLCVGIEEDE